VFLDRDGTIIEDRNYLSDPDGVTLLPGAAEGIARLMAAAWPVIVVTNQSGIGRGLISEAQHEEVEARLQRQLAAMGATLTASYHCPHDPTKVGGKWRRRTRSLGSR
jgi:D-glycero-D-manno-heptose 1,7-bisphosphate phosphatase